jgi:hypothetical protein
VRELLNEDRRFVKLKSFRTPPARLGSWGEEECWAAEAGEVGVWKRLVCSCAIVLSPLLSVEGPVGVVRCELSGPPPDFGMSKGGCFVGDGGGMLVPSVKE